MLMVTVIGASLQCVAVPSGLTKDLWLNLVIQWQLYELRASSNVVRLRSLLAPSRRSLQAAQVAAMGRFQHLKRYIVETNAADPAN